MHKTSQSQTLAINTETVILAKAPQLPNKTMTILCAKSVPYLKDFSKHIVADEHVLMVLDRAGWHRARALRIAENLTILLLPAYSPELNPVELLWWQMRDKHLSNQVFETADKLDRDVGKAWCAVTCQPETVRSLCFFPWIESAINN